MEFIADENYRKLLPDGFYEAQCIKYDAGFFQGKARKLFLIFKILTPGEHFGKDIFMAFNMRYDGKVRAGSKYYKTWVMAYGWRKPSRNAKMSPRIFLNKVCGIKTRTVKPEHNRQKMPDAFWYSVVDYIISINTGNRDVQL